MAMRVSREEFLGVDVPLKPSFENVGAKMALDFEAEVFMRLKKLGLKRKDLADLLDVSPAAVSKLLSEDSNMTLKTMAKVAVALGCGVAPIRLEEVGDVSYADLDEEEGSDSTGVLEMPSPACLIDEPFVGDASAFESVSASPDSKVRPVLSLGRLAA